jgi:hypothetical protein
MTTDVPAALRQLPTPDPAADLRARIVASRASGARAILPTARAAAPRRGALRAGAGIAVAAVVVAAVVSGLLRRSKDDDALASPSSMFFWPAAAIAQEPGGKRYMASHPLAQPDLARVGPGRWIYQTRVIIDGFVTDTVTADTLTIAAELYRGIPTWHITNRWGNRYFAARDTLLVERDGLRPVRRAGVSGRTPRPEGRQQAHAYPRDPAFGPLLLTRVPPDFAGAQLHRFMRPALGLLDYLYLKPALQALPYRGGWRGSIYVIWNWRGATAVDPIPLDVRVIGRERQIVPAGTFECWKVELQVPSNKATTTAWISTDHQWVVRLSERQRDGALEQVLVSATPPAP